MSAHTQGNTPLMAALDVIGMGLIAIGAVVALIAGEPLFAMLMLTIGAASYFARRSARLDVDLAHIRRELAKAKGELASRDTEGGAR